MAASADIAIPADGPMAPSALSPLAGLVRTLRGFALVGIAATIIHYTILMVLTKTGLVASVALANMLGVACSLVVTYTGNHFFVFSGRHQHLRAFCILCAGYIVVMSIHTVIMVGLTGGHILEYLAGPASMMGGQFVVDLWIGTLTTLPENVSQHLTGETILSTSTTLAFLAASGIAMILNFCWNRFVVFHPK